MEFGFWASFALMLPVYLLPFVWVGWRITPPAPHPLAWSLCLGAGQGIKLFLQLYTQRHGGGQLVMLWGLVQQPLNLVLLHACLDVAWRRVCLFFMCAILLLDMPVAGFFSIWQSVFGQPAPLAGMLTGLAVYLAGMALCLTAGTRLMLGLWRRMTTRWPAALLRRTEHAMTVLYLLFTAATAVIVGLDGTSRRSYQWNIGLLIAVFGAVALLFGLGQYRLYRLRLARVQAAERRLAESLHRQRQVLDRLRASRHETGNHLATLQGYLQLGQTRRAREYLRSLLKEAAPYGDATFAFPADLGAEPDGGGTVCGGDRDFGIAPAGAGPAPAPCPGKPEPAGQGAAGRAADHPSGAAP